MKPRYAQPRSLSYREAGVDIEAGERLVERIRPLSEGTSRPGVLGSLGGFGALFELPLDRYRQPVLVSGTDGVGTKLKLATMLRRHDTIGIDLVAMCANDVLVAGAEPLFFLDYYATGRLDVDTAEAVVSGIATGCRLAGAALVGGETAEMPGMYAGSDYDLAGFCVGVVEKDRILDGSRVEAGDALVGIASSGPHSNGYSLIRRIVEMRGGGLDEPLGETTLGEALLTPTRIYVPAVLRVLEAVEVHALAHITGGGLPGNLPRVLPPETRAVIEASAWRRPAVFDWIQEQGGLTDMEMYRTFNCGVGMVLCVPGSSLDETLALLGAAGETAWPIGTVMTGDGDTRVEIRG